MIRIAPEDARGWRNHGLMHLMAEEWKEGIADYDQAIRFDPKDTFSWNNRAIAKREAGDRAGAIADLEQALALSPDMAEIKERLKELGADRDASLRLLGFALPSSQYFAGP